MIFILVGCETMAANYSVSQRSSDITRFAVEIISAPPGAKIEINNDYIGKTPVTVEIEGWEATRTFTRSHTIAAHPLKAGGYSQVKVSQVGERQVELMAT